MNEWFTSVELTAARHPIAQLNGFCAKHVIQIAVFFGDQACPLSHR
jgi:hypothetical protein